MEGQYSPSYRNQSIDLHCRSIDWFLYDGQDWSLMDHQVPKTSLKVNDKDTRMSSNRQLRAQS